MATTEPCPCDPTRNFSECCAPLIGGQREAETAEELLRSRYTAFARGKLDYVVRTHHPKTRDALNRTEIEDWSLNSEWHGMRIQQQEGGQKADTTATIVFQARYRPKPKVGEDPGEVQDHWEQSFFERAPEEGGAWRFLDARGVQVGTYRRAEPKTGRNDPCPCGSGKKFKKCCDAA